MTYKCMGDGVSFWHQLTSLWFLWCQLWTGDDNQLIDCYWKWFSYQNLPRTIVGGSHHRKLPALAGCEHDLNLRKMWFKVLKEWSSTVVIIITSRRLKVATAYKSSFFNISFEHPFACSEKYQKWQLYESYISYI